MNIALAAIVLLMLMAPSAILYISFTYGNYIKAIPSLSLPQSLILISVFSLFIHGTMILALSHFGYDIDFNLLAKLLGVDLEKNAPASPHIREKITGFTVYTACLSIVGMATGRILRIIVRQRDIHFNNETLRIYNYWWYLFHGYIDPLEAQLKQPKNHLKWIVRHDPIKFDLIAMEILVDIKDCTIIYYGLLVDFVCNEENLERIYLKGTYRRRFDSVWKSEAKNEVPVSDALTAQNLGDAGNKDETSGNNHSEGVYYLTGDIFIIKYADIKNANINFITA